MTPNNVFFIGAPKCATTTLFTLFRNRKDVFIPEVKETMHFIKDYWKGDEGYFKTLENKGDKPLLDFQPNHCLYPYVPERIKRTLGEFKSVLIVRDPIERAYSELCHFNNMRPGRGHPDFDFAMEWNMDNYDPNLFDYEGDYMMQADPRGGCYRPNFIENGAYINHINRFGIKNTIVMNYDSLIAHKMDSANHLCELLDMEPFGKGTMFPWRNKQTDDGAFKPSTVKKMREFYKPLNDSLSALVGADFEEIWYGDEE